MRAEKRHDRQIEQRVHNPDFGRSLQIKSCARGLFEPPEEIPSQGIACGRIIVGGSANLVFADGRDALAITNDLSVRHAEGIGVKKGHVEDARLAVTFAHKYRAARVHVLACGQVNLLKCVFDISCNQRPIASYVDLRRQTRSPVLRLPRWLGSYGSASRPVSGCPQGSPSRPSR